MSFYRPQGRTLLRLRCAPDNAVAQRFYKKYGFYKIGEEQGRVCPWIFWRNTLDTIRREDFLPVSKSDMAQRGWDSYDFLVITGDAYVDHPSFGPGHYQPGAGG